MTSALPDDELRQLRLNSYNAEVTQAIDIHEDLRILRVRPDQRVPDFIPGQYVRLGLGLWEPRAAGVQAELQSHEDPRHLVKRAYSISCSMLDESGGLVLAPRCDYLEFYIALVRHSERRPPALSPRLFKLRTGDRLFVEPRVAGHYTLEPVRPEDQVVFLSTGTGEAPHNAMITELLARGHAGRIVSAVCVRHRRDLAYLDKHRELERRFEGYRYLPLTTREPVNLDPSFPGYVEKQHLQDYVQTGYFERDAHLQLDPVRTQVFLCGSPGMIGLPLRNTGSGLLPPPDSMLSVLTGRGFQAAAPQQLGNVHFERYW